MSAVAWPQTPAVWVQIQLRGAWEARERSEGVGLYPGSLGVMLSETWPGPVG